MGMLWYMRQTLKNRRKRWMLLLNLLLLALLPIVLTWSTSASVSLTVSSPELVDLLQDVTHADGYRYRTVDDQNVPMHTVKIIHNPKGGYLGVYHHSVHRILQVRLAVSADLLNWHYVTTLETNASQPTIAALPDGGFVLAYEKNTNETFYDRNFRGSCLALRYYANINNLLKGSSNQSISLKRTLSFSNEGTPNIYNFVLHPDIQHSVIVIGFHYLAHYPDLVDRQGIGSLQNFSFWETEENANLNTLFTREGSINGNIGDRDSFSYQGKDYTIIEAQYTKNDFGSWRPYLYDRTLNTITLLNLRTSKGSKSFGNPTYTEVRLPDGRLGFVTTEFVFGEASHGESGELIYYRAFPGQPAPKDAYFNNRHVYGSPRIHAVLKERRGCSVEENGWPDSCANAVSARNPGAET
jgi:hypothetical protein